MQRLSAVIGVAIIVGAVWAYMTLTKPPDTTRGVRPAVATAVPHPTPPRAVKKPTRTPPVASSAVYAPVGPIQPVYAHMKNLPADTGSAAEKSNIVIPRLQVHAGIYEGTVVDGRPTIVPVYGLTHFPFSVQAGDAGNDVVYGHDDIDGSIFHALGDMRVGDPVYITRGGETYTYRVTGSSIVSPDEVDVMEPTQAAMLTMISCTPLYVDTSRIVVRATLIGSAPTS